MRLGPPALLLAWVLGLSAPLGAMGLRPDPASAAVAMAGQRFRLGDPIGAAAALEPWITRSAAVTREALALRFLDQDYAGVCALAASLPADTADDEARLWVARAYAADSRWQACLSTLDGLQKQARPWAGLLRAEALDALGQAEAPAAYARALSLSSGTRLEALTALQAGDAAERRGDDPAAEERWKQAEKVDPSTSQVHLRLAALYQRHQRWSDARARLERARKVDPDAAAPRLALNQLLAEHPQQQESLKRDAERKQRSFLGRANPVVLPQPRLAGEPTVRVGLLTSAPRFQFRLGGAYEVEGRSLTLPAGSAWEACLDKGGWQLRPLSPSAGLAPVLFGGPLRLRPLDESVTFGVFNVASGAGYFWASNEDRYYRGLMELRPEGAQGLTLVDELGLEAYLFSVVPSEMRAQWPGAALEAQAVAARTDTWRSLGRFKKQGYDLCPTVACAVYAGVGAEDPRTTAAVTTSAGVVLENLRYKLAATFYMHNSGGHTQASSEAWTEGKDNTQGVVDAPQGAAGLQGLFPVGPAGLLHFLDDLDADLPGWPRSAGGATWRWSQRLTPDELAASVARRHPALGRLRTVRPLDRSDGGYAHRVLFEGDEGNGVGSSDYIRSALKGIKSNLFYVELRRDPQGRTLALLFHGGGWGHGVGMSQAGARAMADAGLVRSDILYHYFPGTRLKKRYGL